MGTDGTMATTVLGGNTVTFDFNINSDGTYTGSFSGTNFIAYDSSVAAERVCIPSTKTLTVAFKDYVSAFTSIQSG